MIFGKEKEKVRDYVFDFFISQKSNNSLFLSNLNFSLEKRLIENNFKISSVEKNPIIFKKQVKKAPKKLKIKLGDILEEDFRKYDSFFLDFCGCINKEIIEKLKTIKKGSPIVLTFLKGRESYKIKEIIDINNRNYSYSKTLLNCGVKPLDIIEYADSSPMIVISGIKIY